MTKLNESKKEKFYRLGSSRMNAALEKIRLLENLSSKNNYEYTENDVKKMISALRQAVDSVEKAFKNKDTSSKPFQF